MCALRSLRFALGNAVALVGHASCLTVVIVAVGIARDPRFLASVPALDHDIVVVVGLALIHGRVVDATHHCRRAPHATPAKYKPSTCGTTSQK